MTRKSVSDNIFHVHYLNDVKQISMTFSRFYISSQIVCYFNIANAWSELESTTFHIWQQFTHRLHNVHHKQALPHRHWLNVCVYVIRLRGNVIWPYNIYGRMCTIMIAGWICVHVSRMTSVALNNQTLLYSLFCCVWKILEVLIKMSRLWLPTHMMIRGLFHQDNDLIRKIHR